MWRPSTPMYMMDIENGYFLVKFQNKLNCEKVFSEGPWTIFGQYLTVQPWTMAFDPTQAYPSVVIAWIRFPALPSYLYNCKIITEIGEMVGKVVKLDMNSNSRAMGRFDRMAVYVNLEKPLVTSGPTVEVNIDSSVTTLENQNLVVEGLVKKDKNYGPWMIIERKFRYKFRDNLQKSARNQERE
ncbi:hypothetical protein Goari_016340 [Gossypium aridum]|uniref:DUF4283 domain-containing protein n=1 Tax=Gossypium aridum TaxID=34290 RepID=A0A7J8WJH0_GOSAI|nr:hypothetical protein [Gossypium aridum]